MKQRIISAIIALLIVIPVAIYGGSLFNLFAYVLAFIGLFELLRIKKMTTFIPGIVLSYLLLLVLLIDGKTELFTILFITKEHMIFLLIMALLSYTVLSKNKFTFDDASFLVLSTGYVGLGFFYLMQLREQGLVFLLFVFLIIWATDSGAYFFGRAFGKRKLWPSISPNKTIEGALGGTALAIVVALLFQGAAQFDVSLIYIICIAILIAIAGQMGDLVASAIKRHYNIKDFGNIMPGHGGVLDRLDSMIFVLPLLAIVQFIV